MCLKHVSSVEIALDVAKNDHFPKSTNSNETA